MNILLSLRAISPDSIGVFSPAQNLDSDFPCPLCLIPMPKKGTEKVIAVDNVINAIGQFPVTSFLKDNGVNITRWNTIEVVNELSCETNIEWVFAGGDAVTGASIAVEAIGAGRRAARSIHCYLTPP